MNSLRFSNALLSMAMTLSAFVSIASSQNLSKEWVTKLATPLIENKIADGISIGYIEDKNFGTVHLGTARDGKPADNSTLYEIGSISKVMTALTLADSVLQGKIDLDAAAVVDNAAAIKFPSHDADAIKWIHLATHRSGLPSTASNFVPANMEDPYSAYDSKKAAAFLGTYELPRKPGESYEYSNFGAAVLGYLIAQNAGTNYQQLLTAKVAKPLKMTDCTVTLSDEQKKRLATPHSAYGTATAQWSFADVPGAGGIYASMKDMMRFAKANLYPPKGPAGEAIELAWKQHCDANTAGPAMGLGWHIAADGQTRWHNGGTGGFSTAIYINRKLKSAVVVLSNTSISGKPDELAEMIIKKADGQEVEIPKIKPVVEVDAKHRSRLAGRYQLAPEFIFDIQDKDGRLMVSATNQPTLEVFPESPTHWSARGVDATIEFLLTDRGPAPGLILHQGGMKQAAKRMPDDGDAKAEKGQSAVALKNDAKYRNDAKHRDRLVGRYELNPDFILDVKDDNGTLTVDVANQPTHRFKPDSPTLWSCAAVAAKLEFELAEAGPATSATLIQGGARQKAKRIAAAGDEAANVKIDAEHRKRLVGRYQLNPNFIFDVQDKEGHLMVGITNQPTQEVFPDSPTHWSYRGVEATLEFKMKKTGRAMSLVLHQNGAKQTARRMK